VCSSDLTKETTPPTTKTIVLMSKVSSVFSLIFAIFYIFYAGLSAIVPQQAASPPVQDIADGLSC
jgi:RsiW-degrading membrane proteinase PrsW (M82 family)